MSRSFDTGNGTKIIVAPGALVNHDAGPTTIVTLFHPNSFQPGGIIRAFTEPAGEGSGGWAINPYFDGTYFTAEGGFVFRSYIAPGWQILAFSKAAGTAAVVASLYDYGTDTWDHDTLGTLNDKPGPWGSFRLGSFLDHEYTRGDFAAIGVWDAVLTPTELEGMTTSLAAWAALNPSALWAFNQASVTDPVLDLTGNGADETHRTATAVSANEPPGWSYDLTPPGATRKVRLGGTWVDATRKVRLGGVWETI